MHNFHRNTFVTVLLLNVIQLEHNSTMIFCINTMCHDKNFLRKKELDASPTIDAFFSKKLNANQKS